MRSTHAWSHLGLSCRRAGSIFFITFANRRTCSCGIMLLQRASSLCPASDAWTSAFWLAGPTGSMGPNVVDRPTRCELGQLGHLSVPPSSTKSSKCNRRLLQWPCKAIMGPGDRPGVHTTLGWKHMKTLHSMLFKNHFSDVCVSLGVWCGPKSFPTHVDIWWFHKPG